MSGFILTKEPGCRHPLILSPKFSWILQDFGNKVRKYFFLAFLLLVFFLLFIFKLKKKGKKRLQYVQTLLNFNLTIILMMPTAKKVREIPGTVGKTKRPIFLPT